MYCAHLPDRIIFYILFSNDISLSGVDLDYKVGFVGNLFDPINSASFDPMVYAACASVSGYLPPGGVLEVIYDPPMKGRYLTMYLPGVSFTKQLFTK